MDILARRDPLLFGVWCVHLRGQREIDNREMWFNLFGTIFGNWKQTLALPRKKMSHLKFLSLNRSNLPFLWPLFRTIGAKLLKKSANEVGVLGPRLAGSSRWKFSLKVKVWKWKFESESESVKSESVLGPRLAGCSRWKFTLACVRIWNRGICTSLRCPYIFHYQL